MESVIIIFLIVVVFGLGMTLYLLINRLKSADKQPGVELIKSDLIELARGVTQLTNTLGDKIEKNSLSVQQSMQRQLSESAKLVADVSTRLAKLDETNRRVVDVADELKTLQNVLQNPKQRGGLGEYYLETVLANVLPPHVYETQYRFNDGEIVDAVIHLDKDRIIPIDSKFSLENYNRLIEEKDKTVKAEIVKKFKSDLKKRIDETSKYIRPAEHTLDYAFMFIPSEAIYYDLLVNNVGSTGTNARDLIEYAFIDKRVIIVSPTTLLAYLQTVMQGLRSLQIQDQAKDIQKRVGELGKHIAAHEQYMTKLGAALGQTVGHYNNAHKSLEGMDKDVVKIAGGELSVEVDLLDKPRLDED
ncbi:MAG: DNA recombination protein RmuC [Candidatus Saccharimonas sp.]